MQSKSIGPGGWLQGKARVAVVVCVVDKVDWEAGQGRPDPRVLLTVWVWGLLTKSHQTIIIMLINLMKH